jgi:hypothetical protein
MGYPPLVHQSGIVINWGLKFGLFSVAIIGILLFITGAYRFSLLLTGNRTVAGYTALLAVFFFFVCRNASYFWAATQYYTESLF